MVEVGGQVYQHGTSKFQVTTNTIPSTALFLKTIKKVDFSIEVAKELTNDSQGQVDGFVVKPAKQEASLTLKMSEWLNLLRPSLAVSPGGLLLAQFSFTQTYGTGVAPGNPLHRVDLIGCMINKEAYSSEDTQDADMMELPLIYIKILVDSTPPVLYDP